MHNGHLITASGLVINFHQGCEVKQLRGIDKGHAHTSTIMLYLRGRLHSSGTMSTTRVVDINGPRSRPRIVCGHKKQPINPRNNKTCVSTDTLDRALVYKNHNGKAPIAFDHQFSSSLFCLLVLVITRKKVCIHSFCF